MIEETLLKSNFVGRDGFVWWIGQVAPEDSQDAQINMGGWSSRYKVRIMGYHPYDEKTLKNSDLPWAQVLLGTTDGSGSGNRATSVKISPSDTVFGFFMDGEDAQEPIITGVFAKTNANAKAVAENGKNGEYVSPFVPFTGFTSQIKNDGGYIVNRETNEQSTNSQPSPTHITSTIASQAGEDARSAYNGIGDTVIAATPSTSSTVIKIRGEVGNMVSKLQSMTSDVKGAIGNISGKISKVIGGVTDKIKGLSKGIINNMTNNLFSNGLAPALKGGLDVLYKNVFGAVLSATGKTSIAKKAGAKAQAALKGPIGAIQNILPCITSKIIDGIGSQIKSLLQGIADNVSNFVSCIADQFIGGLMNTIIGGITGFLGPLLGPVSGILDFVGGFDIGGFLRSKAEGLNALLNILTCDTSEPTFNKKTGEWTIGKGAKNALGVSVDAILAVANAADGLVDAVVDGLQEISVASGSLGVWDFMNPSVSNPGFKSPLGECYAGPPLNCAGIKINIFGGGGTDAIGKAIMGSIIGDNTAVGSLIGIDLVSGGSGYTTPPYVEITDNCNKGYGAIARAVIDYDENSPTYQQVTDIYVVSEGENYPIPETQTPVVIDHIVIVNPGTGYNTDDKVTDGDNDYDILVDNEGHIVKVIPPDNTLLNTKDIEDLPLLEVKSSTGYGAILKPSLKARPTYQGEVKQVIDCIT
tara:strand:- start:705 stop:2795 length:2091 start_codon:yes stop_codon:yes gene_type:complete